MCTYKIKTSMIENTNRKLIKTHDLILSKKHHISALSIFCPMSQYTSILNYIKACFVLLLYFENQIFRRS